MDCFLDDISLEFNDDSNIGSIEGGLNDGGSNDGGSNDDSNDDLNERSNHELNGNLKDDSTN